MNARKKKINLLGTTQHNDFRNDVARSRTKLMINHHLMYTLILSHWLCCARGFAVWPIVPAAVAATVSGYVLIREKERLRDHRRWMAFVVADWTTRIDNKGQLIAMP